MYFSIGIGVVQNWLYFIYFFCNNVLPSKLKINVSDIVAKVHFSIVGYKKMTLIRKDTYLHF